jgi:2-aminobenzoylacetyl-CoA thioesterase
MNLPHHYNGISLDFEPVTTSIRAGDGDDIDLGRGIKLQFYLTPGHTRCSLSTYIPALDALFPADALPFPANENDKLIVTANHDYDDYIRSLEKLLPLRINLIGYEHGGMITGEDAATMISKSLAVTMEQRQRIRERFDELKNLDLLVNEIAQKYHALDFFSMAPLDLIRSQISRMVRSALGMI